MKNRITSIIALFFFIIIGLGVTKVYANTSTEYVYMYESTSPIYGGSEENKVKIPIPAGFTYKENETGYISIHDKRNTDLVYIWVPLDNTSNKQQLWKEVYEKYQEEKNVKIKKDSEFYKTIFNSTETLSNEFVNSIKQYKGFYVSEAELSYTEQERFYNKARGMINSSVTNTEEKGDYYRGKKYTFDKMKKIAEIISEENKSVNSHLMYGLEWDAILIWIAKTNTDYKDSEGNSITKILVENSQYVGKYRDSDLVSSISELDTEFFNGIWGLGGNLAEVTQEKYNGKHVVRGGSYNTTGGNSPIASRDTTNNIQKDEIGFRNALYITPNIEKRSWKSVKEEDIKYDEIEELEDIDYSSIDEGKAGSDDKNHMDTGKATVYFSNTKATYTWYFQNAGPWASNAYWDGTIASDGCGPTAIATMISLKYSYNPATVIEIMQNKLKLTPGSDNKSRYLDKLKFLLSYELGFNTVELGTPTNTEERISTGSNLKKFIKSGRNKTVLVCVGPGTFTKGGHYMALIGVGGRRNTTFYVANPNYKTPGGYVSSNLVMEDVVTIVKSSIEIA